MRQIPYWLCCFLGMGDALYVSKGGKHFLIAGAIMGLLVVTICEIHEIIRKP